MDGVVSNDATDALTRNAEAAPEKFQNRTVNKLKYVFWGATQSYKVMRLMFCCASCLSLIRVSTVRVSRAL